MVRSLTTLKQLSLILIYRLGHIKLTPIFYLVQKNDTTNDALLAYQKAADIRHDWHADFYVQLARLLMDDKKFDEAIKYFQFGSVF